MAQRSLPTEEGTTLEFYRQRPKDMGKILARAAMGIGLGGLVTLIGSLSIFMGIPENWKPVFAIIGGGFIFYGLFAGFVSVPRMLRHEHGLSVRSDGLLFERSTSTEFIAWGDIEKIEDSDDQLVLRMRSGVSRRLDERFVGNADCDLGKELEQARKRASLGMSIRPRR